MKYALYPYSNVSPPCCHWFIACPSYECWCC